MKEKKRNFTKSIRNHEKYFNAKTVEIGIPIGSLLDGYWHEKFRFKENKNNKVNQLRGILGVIRFIIKIILLPKEKSTDKHKVELLIGKCDDKRHYNLLIDYIPKNITESMVLDSEYSFYRYLGFYSRLTAIYDSIILFARVGFKLRLCRTGYSKISFFKHLAYSTLKFYLSNELIRLKCPKLIVVDADRVRFHQLILAGNYNDIKTVSLQHGVLNPPFNGYLPLLANEIWVWGSLWKRLLIEQGIQHDRIKIVGSTIVDEINVKKYCYNKHPKIGIGINPVDFSINYALWHDITKILSNAGFEIIIKLHSSMSKDEQLYTIFNNNEQIYSYTELDNNHFFNTIDLLLVSNSGLGYEAIAYGVPIAVVREEKNSTGNDCIMIKDGKFPEISNEKNVLDDLNYIMQNLFPIHEKEQRFIWQEIYSTYGDFAEKLTINEIKKNISNF